MTGRALRPRRGVPADAQILALTCFVVSCGLALWLTRGPALGVAGFSLTWLLLTALFGLAEATEVHVEVRRQTFSLSLSEIPLVIGLFLLGPGWLLAAWLLAAGMLFVVRRTDWRKALFNVGLLFFETALVLSIVSLAPRPQSLSPGVWV